MPYLINYGRDCTLIRKAIDTYGVDITKKLIDLFFETGEDQAEWHSDKITIPVFYSMTNELVGKMRKKEWKKPELTRLKIRNNKVNIKGKLYTIEEILNDNELNKYYHFYPKKTK